MMYIFVITSYSIHYTKLYELIMPEELANRKPMQNCIRCAKCVSVCPMGLSPYLLMLATSKTIWDRAEEEKIMDCIECGSCNRNNFV